jgi:predicted subunit of tRNA(5-methylaminomethyl-2-thiouridylate) methyltransferase
MFQLKAIMTPRCIVLFSGGLDSVIAVHLLKEQGVEVIALHFVLPFDHGIKSKRETIMTFAAQLGVRLRIQDDGADFAEMVKNPAFGFGKHVNPCIDCRIRRLKMAREVMAEENASFIATGEVVGQRPMSQKRENLYRIENNAGLKGTLLRPLSAGLLRPTQAEQEGLVDRNRLLSIQGRGRKEQLAYVARFNLPHFPPAGGCILTGECAESRVNDLRLHNADFTLNDIQLLGIGRHFRISPTLRFIVARDDSENSLLEKFIRPDDYRFDPVGFTGPVGIGRGNAEENESIRLCCSVLARYSKVRNNSLARVSVFHNDLVSEHSIKPASPTDCDNYRIQSFSAFPPAT